MGGAGFQIDLYSPFCGNFELMKYLRLAIRNKQWRNGNVWLYVAQGDSVLGVDATCETLVIKWLCVQREVCQWERKRWGDCRRRRRSASARVICQQCWCFTSGGTRVRPPWWHTFLAALWLTSHHAHTNRQRYSWSTHGTLMPKYVCLCVPCRLHACVRAAMWPHSYTHLYL